MPKQPINYQNCVIYKLEHTEDESLLYVGHTTNFMKRKDCHKRNCNEVKQKAYNYKVYQMMRENGGWDNFKMIEIEKYPCNDKREAEKREDLFMKELKSNMNSIRSFLTEQEKKEYYENNKEQILKYQKKYSQENKEKIKDYLQKYSQGNKDKIRKTIEKNKEKRAEYKKKYYEENKEKLSEIYKEKVICECGCEVNRHSVKRHEQTSKHIKLMNNKSIQ